MWVDGWMDSFFEFVVMASFTTSLPGKDVCQRGNLNERKRRRQRELVYRKSENRQTNEQSSLSFSLSVSLSHTHRKRGKERKILDTVVGNL